MQPPVLLIIGPSGTGKTSVVRQLLRRGLITVTPTYTTRPRRADERDGCDNHRFVTDEQFSWLEARGAFLGTATLFGLPHRYGLPALAEAPGRVPTIVARAAVTPAIVEHHPRHVIWQVEAPAERLLAAMVARRSPAPEIDARLRNLDAEVMAGRRLADAVFVNDGRLDVTVDAMEARLRAQLLGAAA